MLKKLFFMYCLCLSVQAKSFEGYYSDAQINYKLQQNFSRSVLGSNPHEGYFMSLEEQKNNIIAFNDELRSRRIRNENFLKDALLENKLALFTIKPEIVDLLIALHYSSDNIIIPLLERLDLSKLNDNAIGVLKVLQKHCTLTQGDQQKARTILNEKMKMHCKTLVHFAIKTNKEAKKNDNELFINPNYISESEIKECIDIKVLKRLFKPQQQDNQKIKIESDKY